MCPAHCAVVLIAIGLDGQHLVQRHPAPLEPQRTARQIQAVGTHYLIALIAICLCGQQLPRGRQPGFERVGPCPQGACIVRAQVFNVHHFQSGAREVLHGLDIGVLNNRKGPDVDLARRPMMFWSLIVFYATAILISAGMAILLAGIALRRLFGRGG